MASGQSLLTQCRLITSPIGSYWLVLIGTIALASASIHTRPPSRRKIQQLLVLLNMASWEDYADDPDLIPESTTKSTVPEETKQQNPQRTAETAAKTAPAPTAPPKPSIRGGASESSNAGQAYMAAQPKVRILQRAAPANPASRGPSPGQSVADSDESVARLHANYEQKQRDYEAARKKLFDESQAVEESS